VLCLLLVSLVQCCNNTQHLNSTLCELPEDPMHTIIVIGASGFIILVVFSLLFFSLRNYHYSPLKGPDVYLAPEEIEKNNSLIDPDSSPQDDPEVFSEFQISRNSESTLSEMVDVTSPSASTNSSPDCIICATRPIEVVLIPCGHLSLCLSCAVKLPSPKTCPLCRQSVTQIVRVYKS